jgi:MFS family permease
MAEAIAQPVTTPNPMKEVLAIRDFVLLWIGQATSMLGDQFHRIAAAWLVLKLTGDPLALGMVLALSGIPLAVFIVIGGAVTDRFSPRKVMLATDIVRLFLSALLAIQVFTGTLQIWMIYIYAIIGGTMGGLFGPASMSIVPRIIPSEKLQAGNSLTQGSSSLIGFVGPAVAGGMIVAFGNEKTGIGVAIAIDAITFIVSVITLWMMQTGGEVAAQAQKMRVADMLKSVKDGFAYMFKDPVLRLMFVIIAIANMAFSGPIVVGIPYLADTRFPEGAAAYGFIIAGYAGGNLLGIIIAGMLPRFAGKTIQAFMIILFAVFGLGLGAIGWISATWLATFDLFILGILNGYLSVMLVTGLQQNTPKEMLGRLMSMLLLANMSLMPLSQAITGVILRWSVLSVFIIGGAMLLGVAIYLALTPNAAELSARLINNKSE